MDTVPVAPYRGNGASASNPLLQAALRYASQGWHVLPLHNPIYQGCSCGVLKCESIGKHPRITHGLKGATTDAAIIRGWWEQWPDANIGIATGLASGIVVLDVDGVDGHASLRLLEALDQLPRTLRAHSGRIGPDGERNGHHFYFALPNGADLRNSAGRLGKGLDIRASGGYIVAPPSLHASRLCYEWDSAESVIVELPQWLITRAAQPTLTVVPSAKAGIPKGQRNATLTSLAGTMHKRRMSRSSIQAALLEENRTQCNPPLLEKQVMSVIESVTRYPQGAKSQSNLRRADVLCLADVQAEDVVWLWEPYIPLTMITLLSGDPGVGKTFLSLDLAASLTQGRAMFNGAATTVGNVLYLTQENSPAHVLRPRFDALGGDATRFFIVRGTLSDDGTPGNITLGDTDQLEEAIVKHNVRLVVIDPLQSFLGGDVDAHRANQTRPIMDGLAKLAERTGCAILITRHLSKGTGGSAIYRGMGSIDFTGTARSELLVAWEPEQEGRVVMAHSKSNLGKFGPSLEFSIDSAGKLQWHGESSFRADDLLTAPATADERSALDEAVDFLREELADGSKPAKDIQAKAEANGISRATLRRAQAALKVTKGPQGFKGPWMISLRTVAHESPQLLIPTP
ncbi:MAG TPA: bifunctional DNA primase/polymerase [Acidobacteriaceae bacterium]